MVGDQLKDGTRLNDRYLIIRALGQGGMGTVYLAQHERLDTPVAVKEVRGDKTNPVEFEHALEQASKEARFLVKLNHANLPKVTDMFTENDRFYLVMEYIQGVTLEAKLWENGGQPLDTKAVLGWGLQIADVLSYLHSQEPPIIFRDLKPANIMLQPDGNVRLIDFGIARRFSPGASKDTQLLGSVGYSPPEQFGKHQTDTRSDIYAFAATLHHLVTGRDPSAQPFKFPPARAINPVVPEMLSRLLERCLAMDTEQRPRTMQEVAYSLMLARDEIGRPQPVVAAVAHGEHASGPQRGTGSRSSSESGRRGSPSGSSSRSGSDSVSSITTREVITSSLTSPRGIAIAACALVVVGAPTFWFFSRPHEAARGATASPGATGRIVTGGTGADSSPGTAQGQAPAIDQNAGDGGSQSQGTPVSLTQSPASIKVSSDGQGYVLTLSATGMAKGYENSGGQLAVYLYDSNNSPLAARVAADGSSPYATRTGQLSEANSVQIGKDGSVAQSLDFPNSVFPASAGTSGIRCRFKLFVNGVMVGSTEIEDLAISPNSWPDNFFIPDSSQQSGQGSPSSTQPEAGSGVIGGGR